MLDLKKLEKSVEEALSKETPESLNDWLNTKRSGFYDLPGYVKCNNPGHQFPTHLFIPPGKGYRHVCPGCGNVINITSPQISF